jgi:phosphoglycolate phosphatase
MNLLGLSAEAVVYVGDDLRDIQAGFAAGTWTIGCDFGHHVEEPLPRQWGADALIQKAQDLYRFL